MKRACKRTAFLMLVLTGCMSPVKVQHQVEPIKIEITVKIQVEKDLEEFFGDIDNAEVTPTDDDGGSN
jgi:hypothetical protein